MAQHHTLEVMNNLHSLQKALDEHHASMYAALSQNDKRDPQSIENRRMASLKLSTAQNNLTWSKSLFNDALRRMATERQPMAVPGILRESANKLHYANQQLNHPSVSFTCGSSSPITNAESMAVAAQARKNHEYSTGKRR